MLPVPAPGQAIYCQPVPGGQPLPLPYIQAPGSPPGQPLPGQVVYVSPQGQPVMYMPPGGVVPPPGAAVPPGQMMYMPPGGAVPPSGAAVPPGQMMHLPPEAGVPPPGASPFNLHDAGGSGPHADPGGAARAAWHPPSHGASPTRRCRVRPPAGCDVAAGVPPAPCTLGRPGAHPGRRWHTGAKVFEVQEDRHDACGKPQLVLVAVLPDRDGDGAVPVQYLRGSGERGRRQRR